MAKARPSRASGKSGKAGKAKRPPGGAGEAAAREAGAEADRAGAGQERRVARRPLPPPKPVRLREGARGYAIPKYLPPCRPP